MSLDICQYVLVTDFQKEEATTIVIGRVRAIVLPPVSNRLACDAGDAIIDSLLI